MTREETQKLLDNIHILATGYRSSWDQRVRDKIAEPLSQMEMEFWESPWGMMNVETGQMFVGDVDGTY